MLNDLLCDLPCKIWDKIKYIFLADIVLFVPATLVMFVYDMPIFMLVMLAISVIATLVYLGAIILDT